MIKRRRCTNLKISSLLSSQDVKDVNVEDEAVDDINEEDGEEEEEEEEDICVLTGHISTMTPP